MRKLDSRWETEVGKYSEGGLQMTRVALRYHQFFRVTVYSDVRVGIQIQIMISYYADQIQITALCVRGHFFYVSWYDFIAYD
jgi:hypothetical protein